MEKIVIKREEDKVLGRYIVTNETGDRLVEFDAELTSGHYILFSSYDYRRRLLFFGRKSFDVLDSDRRDEAQKKLYSKALDYALGETRENKGMIEDRTNMVQTLL